MKFAIMHIFNKVKRAPSPPDSDRVAEITAKARAHYESGVASPEPPHGRPPLIQVAFLEIDQDQYDRLWDEFSLSAFSALRNRR